MTQQTLTGSGETAIREEMYSVGASLGIRGYSVRTAGSIGGRLDDLAAACCSNGPARYSENAPIRTPFTHSKGVSKQRALGHARAKHRIAADATREVEVSIRCEVVGSWVV